MKHSPAACRLVLSILFLAMCLIAPGCLRQRLASSENEISDHRPIVRQNFGRPAKQRGQVGIDDRAREIESSLGVEGDLPRLFDR